MTEQGPGPGAGGKKKDLLWPIIVTVLLVVVVAVNAAFIFIAVRGADDVDPAYIQGER